RNPPLRCLRHPGALYSRAQATEEIGFWHRLRKQVTLPDLAADGLQLVAFVSGFDAFGDGAQAEAAAKFDDRLAQAGIGVIGVTGREGTAITLIPRCAS